jgi:N-acetylmuramoyl-L-alanine amidase
MCLSSADPRIPVEVVPSPNHGERRGARPDMLILHYTGMPDVEAALRRLCSPESEVSAHYLVFEDGRIVQCVAEGRRAWHAGVSAWADIADINSRSIGVEIANPGHEFGYRDFPSRQIEAVTALCRDILGRHRIRADRVLAHSDVAARRRQDPGERFPWRALYEAGVGLWIEPISLDAKGDALLPGRRGPAVAGLQADLRCYGYWLQESGLYGDETEQVVRAFQRHFRPARIDGIADASTRQTLTDLLAARSRLMGVTPK